MAKKVVYRTDECELPEGEVILPRGDHMTTQNEKLHQAERLLRTGHPEGEKMRTNCIYVWENLRAAKSNWWAEKHKHLYQLEVCDADIIHRGDALLLAEISALAEASMPFQDLVKKYWGEEIERDHVELLVRKAAVTKKLKDKSEPRPSLFPSQPTITNDELDQIILGGNLDNE